MKLLWRFAPMAALAAAAPALAQGNDAELATKLSNPVASMISLPFQYNWDHEFGDARDGHKSTLNVQPVIPAALDRDWTLISRVIVPLVDQRVPALGDGSHSGVGDITGEFFLVPKAAPGGLIWGAGPAILAPTHTDHISGGKWAAGPTGVILHQANGWTYGALANHLWSMGGSGPQSISNTFVQPFLSYTSKDAWTYSINAESTYDWTQHQWTVPVNANVAKLVRFGTQPVSLGIGARYYADSPANGPHGWGVRLVMTFLFAE